MVTQRNATRPTREQILFGLRECFAHWIPEQAQIDPEADFVAFVLQHGIDWNEPGWTILLEGIEPIQKYFGFQVTDFGWDRVFSFDEKSGFAPAMFGQLADFVAERVDINTSFEPATIFGRTCRPAGVFLGMEELAKHIDSEVEKFGPSTPIRGRFRGQPLIRYFNLLRCLTNGCAPKVNDPATKSMWRTISDYSAISLGLYSFVLAIKWLANSSLLGEMSPPIFVAGGLASFVLFFVWMAFVIRAGHLLVRRFVNPLPPGVETFRDLAKLIAYRMEANSSSVPPATQVGR
jgi:hypothetical protein